MKKSIAILFIILFSACKQTYCDTVYYNGAILTMEADHPQAEALAVKDGKIIFVGDWTKAQNLIGKNTVQVDLQNKALMPGFIDVHGHITSSAGMMQAVDLAPSPYGKVNSIENLQLVLKEHISNEKITLNTPILGNGYDDAIMEEHRHPTRWELDAVSTTNPIMVIHTSGHASVANSAMLKLLGIDEDVKDPEGGHYRRDKNTNKLNGKLEENACFTALMKLTSFLPKSSSTKGLSQELTSFLKAQDQWLSYGQTTICDGRTMGVGLDLLKEAAAKGLLKADLVYFPDYEANKQNIKEFIPHYMRYENRLKFGGFKFSNDGSPQGKTAWLTQPYLVPPEGQTKDYKGFPIFTDEILYQDLKTVFSNGITAQLHVNGDAAIDQALRVISTLKNEGVYKPDLRAMFIHVQNSRPDHIKKIREIGVIPSYFSSHVYLWGDWHYTSVFGPERASFISPAKAAKDADITFTIHHDAPVTPPDLITGVYAAVNRTTRLGMVLGPDERISTLDAFKAITLNAAYQLQEEKIKGSLKVGKLADMVILDKNPLKMDPKNIRNLQVLETIKEGKTIFKK